MARPPQKTPPAEIHTVADDPRQDALFAPPAPAAAADFEPGDFSDDPDPDNPFGFAWRQGTATPDGVVKASVALAYTQRSLNLSDPAEKALVGMAILAQRTARR